MSDNDPKDVTDVLPLPKQHQAAEAEVRSALSRHLQLRRDQRSNQTLGPGR